MTCTDCHNPHGSFTEALLREASVNENCYKCHAEKRGPFLLEHAPVRENCLNCHDPHGIQQRILAENAAAEAVPAVPHNRSRQSRQPDRGHAFNRACQNCHTQIHGSNAPAGICSNDNETNERGNILKGTRSCREGRAWSSGIRD